MKPVALALTLLFSASLGFGETALEIAEKFETQKIEAINAYLEANPDAEDKDIALSILVGAHLSMGKFEAIPGLLDARYELQPKGPEANLESILNEIVRPYIDSAIVSNQRDKAKAFVSRVKTDFSDVPQLERFIDQLASALYLPGVGDKMEFAFTDLKGNEIDLSKMEDKIVLVDFWATWCGPCVAELPNLISAYETYHDKGFEIVGISLDQDKAALESFVEQRNIPWPQYFDGSGFENELAQKYGINQIPSTFLVGKDGTIVAANLRGEELEKAVKEALGIE